LQAILYTSLQKEEDQELIPGVHILWKREKEIVLMKKQTAQFKQERPVSAMPIAEVYYFSVSNFMVKGSNGEDWDGH